MRYTLKAFLLSALITMAVGGAANAGATDPEASQVAIESAVGDSRSPTADRQHLVEIKDFQYSPVTLTVGIGDMIVFVNRDVVPHTVTGMTENWDSGALASQQSWSMVVTEGMAGDYFCVYHPSMKATLSIQ